MKKQYSFLQKILSGILCVAMVLGLLPALANTAAAATHAGYVSGTKKADPATIDWQTYFGEDKLDTEFVGMVWTDKSVFGEATDLLPGITLNNADDFLIALSAMSSNIAVTGHTSSPTDTMLILDISGSMVDDTYSVGYTQSYNNYSQTNAIDMDIIQALVDSTNEVVASLMAQNTNNRVGVVLYSGNTATNQSATTGTATVVLPLGRYHSADSKYLELDAPTTTKEVFEWQGGGRNGRWVSQGKATYVAAGTEIKVKVASNLKTEAGGDVADTEKEVVGGTYIQNGLYKAMNEFLKVNDTVVPEGRPQAGAQRTPVIVLMSDGAPTIATTSYTNIGSSNIGNGTATNDHITMLTQLTAAYVKGTVADHYKESATDNQKALILTLGLGTSNNAAATNTLYPAGNSGTLTAAWNQYLATPNGVDMQLLGGLNVQRNGMVAAMNYVDKYYYASNAQGLIDSFKEIINEIQLQAASYTTLVQGGDADLSGYVTFEDELGELMEVKDMKGILLGNILFSGKEVAKAMNEGTLGTPQGATELGTELVNTVKERIPGLTTTLAQQLIHQAYLDGQLHYTDANNWSNYIGWYADANGNYVGFWDKDTGITPYEGAVYINRSYGYLGTNGNSDMMHVVVMVRENIQTRHQTVYFKIPAALLPTVTYKVTLDEDDPNAVASFERVGAEPIQLVFEVGLRSDINAVNLEEKVAAHIAAGGHVHRKADGSIELYTNSWAIGNDLNGNGVPDPDEVDSAVVAESHFHPALENSRYYFMQDALVLDANGNPVTGDTRPAGTGYHHEYYIYDENGRTTVDRALSAVTLSKTKKNADGQWYVPAGTAYRELTVRRTYKTENTTGTLEYSDYPAIFADENIDVYNFLGNNGTVTIAPASGFALTKLVDGTIENVDTYTFRVTLSDTAAQPILTDENGDALPGVTMSAVNGGVFTVTMPADVTAYITGIAPGTDVTVEEVINGDYRVTGITVGGAAQTGAATFTVPAYAVGAKQIVPVSFTNAANGYGDLMISKEIVHNLATDPQAQAGKEFTFRVKLSGDKIREGQVYQTSGEAVKVDNNGYLLYADGSAITVKDQQSLTIYHIPDGTIYTVTEEETPGFTLESINGDSAVTQTSGVIFTDAVARADFVNRYPDSFTAVEVPVSVDVTKVLNAITPYTGDEEFTFAVQMLMDDGSYRTLKALAAKAGETDTESVSVEFEKLGRYYFRIVEVKPAEQTPGMDYATQQSLFEINVTDEDMDGVPEVAVRDEANVTVGSTYANDDPEQITGIRVAATFTNTYEVGSTNTELTVHKVLNDSAAAGKQLTDFHFTLYPCDGAGNVAQGAEGMTVTTSALGDATFHILLDTQGTYYYKVAEQIPAAAVLDSATGKYVLGGMYYDATEYLLTVVVQPEDQNLKVTSQVLQNLTTGAVMPQGVAVFENDYILQDASVSLPLRKVLTGRALAEGETFRFVLTRTDAAYVPYTDSRSYSDTKETADTARFDLTFHQVGVYHYKLTEEIPATAVNGVADGLVYDTAEYHITVTVTDKGDGTLTANWQMVKMGQANPADEAVFTNEYRISGEGSVVISGKKTLNGRTLYAQEFTFGLYDNAQCLGEPIATATNAADGSFAFPKISYTAADLAGSDTKTHIFYVKEIAGTLGGVTYDSTVHTVTVTVSHDKGVLVVTPSANYNALQIVNTYEATGTQVVLDGEKVLVGDWTSVSDENKTFAFFLYETGADFIVTGDPVDTAYVTGEGLFSFDRHYNDGDEGYYYYVIKEDTSTAVDGAAYDAGEYHITVNVFDPGAGALAARVTMYRPGTGDTQKALFSNFYEAREVEMVLKGEKIFTDLATNQSKEMTEGQFRFVVLEDGYAVATGYNKADGTIEFTPIRYLTAGSHTYTVAEVAGNEKSVRYDDSVFTVQVTVTDNGEGQLVAVPAYSEAVVFNNTYAPASNPVTGDGFDLSLIIGLTAFSGFAITVLAVLLNAETKKKKEEV